MSKIFPAPLLQFTPPCQASGWIIEGLVYTIDQAMPVLGKTYTNVFIFSSVAAGYEQLIAKAKAPNHQPSGVTVIAYGAEWSTTISNNPAD